MKLIQYIVTFVSGYTDLIEAESVKQSGTEATFRLGGGKEYTLYGVDKVEVVKKEVVS